MILAGDVGGTSTRFGLFKTTEDKNKVISVKEQSYRSQEAESFTALVEKFRQQIDADPQLSKDEKYIGVACFGFAGPIKTAENSKKQITMTNVPHWPMIQEEELSALLNNISVIFLNDMEAVGYGICQLDPEKDFAVLNQGTPHLGNQALVAAGTGLGEAMLFWNEQMQMHIPSPSEGAHANFAPRTAQEVELLRYLGGSDEPWRISFEEVISGNGLVNIYEFLKSQGKTPETPEIQTKLAQAQDKAAVISEAGLKAEDELSRQALDMFISLYGAEAGNVALKYLAYNGVFLAGGITPKILERIKTGGFMTAFKAKAKGFDQLNADMPVKAILNDKVGLLGTAWRGSF